MYTKYKDLGLISCTKFKKLKWAGRVQRLPLDRIAEKALKAEFTGN